MGARRERPLPHPKTNHTLTSSGHRNARFLRQADQFLDPLADRVLPMLGLVRLRHEVHPAKAKTDRLKIRLRQVSVLKPKQDLVDDLDQELPERQVIWPERIRKEPGHDLLEKERQGPDVARR